MTISDVEYLTGMVRANIRFYEEQGLISPERGSNGYRDYSKSDIEILKRIKLLRTLHMSLDDIKLLSTGEKELDKALEEHLKKLEADKKSLENSERVCKAMHDDGAKWESFDAQKYLDKLAEVFELPIEELETDTLPLATCPIRRYIAKQFDMFFYTVLWVFVLYQFGVFIWNCNGPLILFHIFIMPVILMHFLEPAFLALFGTTPGKAILGLHITNNTGQRLTYSEGFARTLERSIRGNGVWPPVNALYAQYQCFKACEEGETLEWEYDSRITLRGEETWRSISMAIASVLLTVALVILLIPTAVRLDRAGEVTVSEFARNYNELAGYHYGTMYMMSEGGRWSKSMFADQLPPETHVDGYEYPPYQFELVENENSGLFASDKVITIQSVSFTIEQEGIAMPASYLDDMKYAIEAFVREHKDYKKNAKELEKILNSLPEYENFEFEILGVKVSCTIEHSGYRHLKHNNALFRDGDAETYYKVQFFMTKN